EQQAAEKTESLPSEYETMSKVVEGTIQQAVPEFQASSHAPVTISDDVISPQDTEKIQNWINLTFTKGIWQGIQAAKTSGDIALIDAFHSLLSGQLYQNLIDQKKIPTL